MVSQSIQVITQDDIEARIYRVPLGYRIEISTTLVDYWHPGVFRDIQQLEEWLNGSCPWRGNFRSSKSCLHWG